MKKNQQHKQKQKSKDERKRDAPDFAKTAGKTLAGISLSGKLTILLAIGIAFYAFTQNILFAFAAFALMTAILALEFSPGKTFKQNILEFAYALVFAVAAWFLLGFFLQTDSPINVVTSCSMLPTLERGDLIFIRGGVENAPTAIASVGEMQAAQVHKALCIAGKNSVPCTDDVRMANQTIRENNNNDIIVFNPKPTGPGLLIHRVFARVETPEGIFFLTKGDNNPVLDQENGRFNFVSEKDVKGRVVLRIPYVGYLKLLLFLQFDTPAGCDTVLRKA